MGTLSDDDPEIDAVSAGDRRYSAFFSYSRGDSKLAAKLHRALDTYKVPRSLRGAEGLRGAIPETLHPIFRDKEDLSGGGDLAQRLQSALLDSNALIVLCTPNSAQSHWVNQEIETFQREGRDEDIFPVIGSGDPGSSDPEQNCLPPALSDNQVLAADLRDILQDDGRIIGDGFDGAKLKLIAGLLGIELDQLRRREDARRRKQLVLAGLAAVTFLALAVMSGFLGFLADRNAREAETQKLIAEQNAERALRGEALAEKRAEAESLARQAEERERERADSERDRAEENAEEALRQAAIALSNKQVAEAETARAQLALAQAITQGARLAQQQGRTETALRMALASGQLSREIAEEQRVLLARLTTAPSPLRRYEVPTSDVVTFLTLSPNGSHVMSSGLGGTARLYNTQAERISVAIGRDGTDLGRRGRARTGVTRGLSGASATAAQERRNRTNSQSRGMAGRSGIANSRGFAGQSAFSNDAEAVGGTRLANNWFSRDGKFFLNTFVDGTFEIRRTSTGRISEVLGTSGADPLLSASFNPITNQVLTSSLGGTASLWAPTSRSLSGYEPVQTLAVPGIRSAAWTSDGLRVITTSIESGLQVWRNGRVVAQIANSPLNSGALAISADDRSAIEIDHAGTVRLTSLATGEVEAVLRAEDLAPGAFVISSDTRFVIVGQNSGGIVVWDIATRQPLASFDGHDERVSALAISADNRVLASATPEGDVRLWSLSPLYASLASLVAGACEGRIRNWSQFTADERAGDPMVASLGRLNSCGG